MCKEEWDITTEQSFFKKNWILIIFALGLIFFANEELFVMSYLIFFLVVAFRTGLMPARKTEKVFLIVAYVIILTFQISMVEGMLFGEAAQLGNYQLMRRIIAVAMILLPPVIGRYIVAGKNEDSYLPSVEDVTTLSMSDLRRGLGKIKEVSVTTNTVRKKLSIRNISEVIKELPRNNSFKYINNGSLTEEYFQKVEETLDDENIYLVISKTGSPASEIISVFTGQQYNHASLSFDGDLETVISYNGGEKVYPPGLNAEMIEFFKKTPDSKILVYSLPCSKSDKVVLMNKVKEINQEGSAYNMLGLVIKKSYKPNIMFCSQFVYKMIEYVGISYFEKGNGFVSPTDLIELDYYKKLKFEREIIL